MLAGRYLLGARLGRGGMGTVWRATDQMLDREVAVKELSVGHLAEEDLQIVQSRMKQEARAAARIKHPGVITIHDVVEQDGKPWIVMELIDGRSLSELVEQDGVIDPREAARIGAQVLAALERAHAVGVIHRDVKPANVLLERGTGRVVLTDFGIATFVGDSALTRTGDLVGSPDYLAPERVHGGRPGPESDLWALGATLYAAVEGQSPFRRESPLTTLAAVVTDPLPEPRNAGALAPVLQALMAKEPQERPGASDVRRMLEDVAAGHTTNISLGSLGTGPLRTPTQKVPAVDRQSMPAESDAEYIATVLGTTVNGAAAHGATVNGGTVDGGVNGGVGGGGGG
ncbi:serine/threonine-protein kinase, partial [Streptacidiphilus neutrinimicus]|uniref:serine/threonine-protein kinase n=1 Tax=Streptacidiphilus neutrinimicus TaxID=105420 RepID=UPI0012698BD0